MIYSGFNTGSVLVAGMLVKRVTSILGPPRGKYPQFAREIWKIHPITAPDFTSLTVFFGGHFWQIISCGDQVILSPDASMALFLRLKT
jgi:hypothetical protein